MRKYWLLPLVLILLLTGCGSDDPEENAVPTATVQPSRTPLPPTWTATPSGFVASPTATLTLAPTELGASSNSSNTSGQSTLPPTWTPFLRASVTPRHTALPEGAVVDESGTVTFPTPIPPGATWTPLPEFCNELQRLTADETIVIGEPALVTWQPITGVTDYEVAIWYSNGEKVFSEHVIGESFEVPSEVFNSAGVYQYEITPLDANGQPICYSISWELFVTLE